MRLFVPFRDAPIRHKLMLIGLLTTALALFSVSIILVARDWVNWRDKTVSEMEIYAALIGANAAPSMIFGDYDAATEVLRTLRGNPNIVDAALYDRGGEVFVRYRASEHPDGVFPLIEPSSYLFNFGQLVVSKPVVLKGEVWGTVYLESDLRGLYADIKRHTLLTFIAAAGVFMVALFLFSRLQRTIVDPITNLSGVMREVSAEQDYAVRVPVHGKDEVGVLAGAFNDMLAQIQARDEALARHGERLEQEVAQRTAKLTEAQRIAHLGNWEWDIASNTLNWSDEIYRIFGLSPQRIGFTVDAFLQAVHPEDRQLVEQRLREALEQPGTFSVDHRILLPDGTVRYVHEQAEVVRGEDGQAVKMQGTLQDVTEDKRLELEARQRMVELTRANAELHELNARLAQAQSQLLQSEKMASIGMLAAGVAHEINNPIGYIRSNLGSLANYVRDFLEVLEAYEKVEGSMPDRSELFAGMDELKGKVDLAYIKQDVMSLLHESHEGVERVTKIVQDLKDFSRIEAKEQWTPEDIHHGLDSTLNVIWNELKYKCEVVKEYGELPKIYCLPSQLNQVFMNLLVNAAQAIDVRGKITIRTGSEGDRVWVDISDTGQGIPPENIPRLFEPFFTTKPVGKGTGLGLSVTYNIVEKHHGKIEVQSEVGKGTTFRVWLPIQQQEAKENA